MLFLTLAAEYAASENEVLEALLARIAKSDKDALAELYERTNTAVYGFVMSISQCHADAEDVLQETYINVFSSADRYRPQGKPMAWILTISKNLARMRLRELKRQTELPDDDWSLYFASNPAVSADEAILLNAAMKKLTEEEKRIVLLHAVSGLKHREVAELLEIPTATVLSKYARAIKKLKAAMEVEHNG